MTKSNFRTIASIAAVCALLLAYVVAATVYQSRFAPAIGVRTYAQLKAQGVPIKRAVRVSNPANHIVVFGDPTAALWTLPSGPPAYLFDETGQLIDFTIDAGDSAIFQEVYNIESGVEVRVQSLDILFASTELPQPAGDGNEPR